MYSYRLSWPTERRTCLLNRKSTFSGYAEALVEASWSCRFSSTYALSSPLVSSPNHSSLPYSIQLLLPLEPCNCSVLRRICLSQPISLHLPTSPFLSLSDTCAARSQPMMMMMCPSSCRGRDCQETLCFSTAVGRASKGCTR